MAVQEDFGLEKVVRSKLIKSSLDMIVLTLMKEKPSSGYDIIGFVYDRFRILLSPGTVYPVLANLEKKGLIELAKGNRKKLYRLTRAGLNAAEMFSLEYSRVQAQLQVLWKSLGAQQRFG